MANAVNLRKNPVARIMLVGHPGAGKTGALACLANAGFKLRILDFDGNLEPLLMHTKPEFLQNIDAVFLEDRTKGGPQFTEIVGQPKAFITALRLMDEWKYTEADGTEVNLGKSSEWGDDTVVVMDSLTTMGDAAMNRARASLNKTRMNTTDGTWGLAMDEQAAFIERLTSGSNRHHVIVLSHLKMIGPKEVRKGDDDVSKEIKERLVDLVPTRYFPSALGWQLPQKIGAAFPTIILLEPEYRGNSAKRKLRTLPRAELDLKVPAPDLPVDLDVSDGLLKVFQALGCNPPKSSV